MGTLFLPPYRGALQQKGLKGMKRGTKILLQSCPTQTFFPSAKLPMADKREHFSLSTRDGVSLWMTNDAVTVVCGDDRYTVLGTRSGYIKVYTFAAKLVAFHQATHGITSLAISKGQLFAGSTVGCLYRFMLEVDARKLLMKGKCLLLKWDVPIRTLKFLPPAEDILLCWYLACFFNCLILLVVFPFA